MGAKDIEDRTGKSGERKQDLKKILWNGNGAEAIPESHEDGSLLEHLCPTLEVIQKSGEASTW